MSGTVLEGLSLSFFNHHSSLRNQCPHLRMRRHCSKRLSHLQLANAGAEIQICAAGELVGPVPLREIEVNHSENAPWDLTEVPINQTPEWSYQVGSAPDLKRTQPLSGQTVVISHDFNWCSWLSIPRHCRWREKGGKRGSNMSFATSVPELMASAMKGIWRPLFSHSCPMPAFALWGLIGYQNIFPLFQTEIHDSFGSARLKTLHGPHKRSNLYISHLI